MRAPADIEVLDFLAGFGHFYSLFSCERARAPASGGAIIIGLREVIKDFNGLRRWVRVLRLPFGRPPVSLITFIYKTNS
jgi:hypothetical protein